MLRPYLKIWDWDWIFGRAVKAFSSLGVHSPWFRENVHVEVWRWSKRTKSYPRSYWMAPKWSGVHSMRTQALRSNVYFILLLFLIESDIFGTNFFLQLQYSYFKLSFDIHSLMHNEGNWVLNKGQEISEGNCCVSNFPKRNPKRKMNSIKKWSYQKIQRILLY